MDVIASPPEESTAVVGMLKDTHQWSIPVMRGRHPEATARRMTMAVHRATSRAPSGTTQNSDN
jgi:hypothetical protein